MRKYVDVRDHEFIGTEDSFNFYKLTTAIFEFKNKNGYAPYLIMNRNTMVGCGSTKIPLPSHFRIEPKIDPIVEHLFCNPIFKMGAYTGCNIYINERLKDGIVELV